MQKSTFFSCEFDFFGLSCIFGANIPIFQVTKKKGLFYKERKGKQAKHNQNHQK